VRNRPVQSHSVTPDQEKYINRNPDNFVIAVGIESKIGHARLDDFLRISEIDAIWVGPHDLSVNLGIPNEYESSIFLDAVIDIAKRTRAAGKSFIWCSPRLMMHKDVEMLKYGVNAVMFGPDTALLKSTVESTVKFIKGTTRAPGQNA